MKIYNKNISLLFLSLLFILSSFLIYRFFIYKRQEIDLNEVKGKVLNTLRLKIEDAEKISNKVATRISQDPNYSFTRLLFETENPYLIYQNKSLIFWSDNEFFPAYETISGNYKNKYFYFRYGKFIISRSIIKTLHGDYEIFVLIPLTFKYPIKNEFIQSGFNKNIFNSQEPLLSNDMSFGGARIHSKDGEYLFTLAIPNPVHAKNSSALICILVLSILSGICFTIYLYTYLVFLIKSNRTHLSLLVLLFVLFVVRAVLLILNLPYRLYEWDLFDSKYFASSLISPSLGDLFINLLFVTCFSFYIFFIYFQTDRFKEFLFHIRKKKWISFILVIFSFLGYYQIFDIFLTINRHSQWIIDINETITFNLFRLSILLSFLLVAINYFIYLHFISRILIFLNSNKKVLIGYVLSTIPIGLFLYLFDFLPSWELVIIHAVFLVIVLFFRLPKYLKSLKYETYIYYILIAGVSSIAGALGIYKQNIERTVIQKTKFASQMLTENDVLGEYLLSDAQKKIENDQFIVSQFLSFFSNKDLIEQKIKRIFLSNYFEKYDVKVSLYDAQGIALNPFEEHQDYREAALSYGNKEYKTDHRNVFFIQQQNKFDFKRYVVFNRITRNDITVGFILIQLFNRKIIPNSVYPELLMDEKFGQATQTKYLNYAIYQGGELVLNSGVINYEQYFPVPFFNNPKLFNEGITDERFHHLGIKDNDGQTIIISTNKYTWKQIFSNFSFLFLVLIFFILLVLFFIAFYFKLKNLSPTYSTKIQIYLNIAFFLPLFIVSITTLSVISSSHTESVQESFKEKAENISRNISSIFEELGEKKISKEAIGNTLSQLARYTDSDINFYGSDGRLIFASQPMIFETGLLTRLVNPKALIEIKEARKGVILLSESLGSLHYNSVYVAVRNFDNGRLIGILSIPFYESKMEIEKQILDVLTTILNIFISIFIIFLILSYFASQILTIPLKIITAKIKRTTLTEENEPLQWQAGDEIGLLVGEYNKMLVKLDQSKEALSKNEKEMAWREMAQQVAHEIKNPLTPMKLTIQYLQMGIRNMDETIIEKVNKGLSTLLTQVDNLNEIATSFSLFAKMPIPKNEVVCITTLLNSIIGLYNNSTEAIVIAEIPDAKIYVNGDVQSLNGVITNLIINAIQSVPSSRKPIVKIRCNVVSPETLRIEVIDNGSGIPLAIQEKIFLPNFSTKYAGSGIGLAVARRSVEHIGGKIFFTSEENTGTTFVIELPILRTKPA